MVLGLRRWLQLARSVALLRAVALAGAASASASAGGRPPPCALKGGCPDNIPALCQPAASKPNWPTFHLMDNVTRLKDGRLSVEGLNDMNAIFFHRGLYHVMNQAGGGDWVRRPTASHPSH